MPDTVSPVITDVTSSDEYSVTITFSEDVAGADDIGNYKVFDKDGERIQISDAQYTGDGEYTATIRFDVELGGEYTIEVSNITDTSDTPNTIETVQETFIVDNILPEDTSETDEKRTGWQHRFNFIIGGGALLLIIIAVLIIVLNKRKKKKAAAGIAAMPVSDVPKTRPLQAPPQKTVAPQESLFTMPLRIRITKRVQ